MTTEVKCAAESAPLSHVIQAMKKNRHSCMVITDNETPIGIITERELLKNFATMLKEAIAYDPPVGTIMSTPPITIDANCKLFEALVVARSNQIRHLLVVDGEGKLAGLVTQSDLVAAHFRIVRIQSEILEHEVTDRIQELETANKKLLELSLEDALLNIGNRRAMEADLAHTHATAFRYQRMYTVVLFDVDYFKFYNDHYGHGAGDEALKQVSQFLQNSIHKCDRLYRYGGEELLLLLPEISAEGGECLAQRLVQGLADCRIPHERHPLKVVTVSGGISCPAEEASDEPWHDVVQRADRALYQVKRQGRNRVASFYFSDLFSLRKTG